MREVDEEKEISVHGKVRVKLLPSLVSTEQDGASEEIPAVQSKATKFSFTAFGAIVASAIAVSLPVTEAVRGWYELRLNAADHDQQVEIEFLKLVTGKDVAQSDRDRVLHLLASSSERAQLREWAKRELATDEAMQARAIALAKNIEESNRLADKFERDFRSASYAVDVAKPQIDVTISQGDFKSLGPLYAALATSQAMASEREAAWTKAQNAARAIESPISDTTTSKLPNGAESAGVTLEVVSKMFPATPLDSIRKNLPVVLSALSNEGLGDRTMIMVALATIRAEDEGFLAISEGVSRFNTSVGGHPFDLYDKRPDLGNKGAPDGERFKGRGFVLLTGRAYYERFSRQLGLGSDLVDDPERANDPEIAARILASLLKTKEAAIRQAISENDLVTVRRLSDGGISGLSRFVAAIEIGEKLLGIDAATSLGT